MPALYFVPLAALFTIATKGPVVFAVKRNGAYDNRHPRDQAAALTGWGKRAAAAHQNSFEALLFFATGMLAGAGLHASEQLLTACAVAFFVSRVIYIGLYIANLSTLRTLFWAVGFASCIVAGFGSAF